MKNFSLLLGAVLLVSACTITPIAKTTASTNVSSAEAAVVDASAPVTVKGGSDGGQCLAVDVLANDGAFIRRGTRGVLSKSGGKDTFAVNGVAHDVSGINYSVKGC